MELIHFLTDKLRKFCADYDHLASILVFIRNAKTNPYLRYANQLINDCLIRQNVGIPMSKILQRHFVQQSNVLDTAPLLGLLDSTSTQPVSSIFVIYI